MSFFKRLKNVVSAKTNKALEKHEDPIELLELSIGKKEKLLIDAKKQCVKFHCKYNNNIRKDKVELIEKASKYRKLQSSYIKREDTEN